MSPPVEDDALFNLEQYLSKLTLQPLVRGSLAPHMPPPYERSHLTPLTLVPGGYRRLREMHAIDLDGEAGNYFIKVSKATNLDSTVFRDLDLELKDDIVEYSDGNFNPYLVNSAPNVVSLLHRFLLRSTQSLLETFDPSMRDWSFQTIRRPRANPAENQSLDPILFRKSGCTRRPGVVKLVIAPLGPWEFASQDFTEFTSMQRFDDTPADRDNFWASPDWVNADRMWAYLYDLCLDFNCPYFAVTSHEQWAFGVFSKYYTSAWRTPPMSFNNRPTSIVEALTYWIHASFSRRYTAFIPQAHRERNLREKDIQEVRRLHAKRFLDDDFSGEGLESASGDRPPTKRQRIGTTRSLDEGIEQFSSQASAGFTIDVAQGRMDLGDRFRKPKKIRRLRRLRNVAKKKTRSGLTLWKNRSTESVLSVVPSVAPSSADPLPEHKIPKIKTDSIQRWRDMVARVQEHGDTDTSEDTVAKGKWVEMLVCNPTTGSETGDRETKSDHTCPSCCPLSPTLTACSLSSAELAMLNIGPVEEFHIFPVSQWL